MARTARSTRCNEEHEWDGVDLVNDYRCVLFADHFGPHQIWHGEKPVHWGSSAEPAPVQHALYCPVWGDEEMIERCTCGADADPLHAAMLQAVMDPVVITRSDGRRVDWDSLTPDEKMNARLSGTEFAPLTVEQRVERLERVVSTLSSDVVTLQGQAYR
jgi:hypothetical protein